MLAFGQNRNHKEVKMYTACCFMVIQVCVKFGIPMSKSKDYVMTKIHGEMYEKIYVTNRLILMHLCAKYCISICQRAKSHVPKRDVLSSKPPCIDLEVKSQRLVEIIDMCNTSSHADRLMFQWQRSYRSDTKTCQRPCKFDL